MIDALLHPLTTHTAAVLAGVVAGYKFYPWLVGRLNDLYTAREQVRGILVKIDDAIHRR